MVLNGRMLKEVLSPTTRGRYHMCRIKDKGRIGIVKIIGRSRHPRQRNNNEVQLTEEALRDLKRRRLTALERRIEVRKLSLRQRLTEVRAELTAINALPQKEREPHKREIQMLVEEETRILRVLQAARFTAHVGPEATRERSQWLKMAA